MFDDLVDLYDRRRDRDRRQGARAMSGEFDDGRSGRRPRRDHRYQHIDPYGGRRRPVARGWHDDSDDDDRLAFSGRRRRFDWD